MPRVKQPHTPPISLDNTLDGCIITFVSNQTSGITANHPDLDQKDFEQLKSDIEECGGAFAGTVGASTHLVATEEQFKKNGAKIKQAIKSNIYIITFDWLVDCLNSEDHADEADYALSSTTRPPAVNGASKATAASSQPKGMADSTKTKRARDESEEPPDSPPKKLKSSVLDSMTASTKGNKNVPVDEFYMREKNKSETNDKACRVYQSGGVIYDATLNQTQAGSNANKFYRIQLLQYGNGNYFTWTRWGRVGLDGQFKLLGDGELDTAIVEFEKKFKDKTGNQWANRDNFKPNSKKYILLDISYESSEEEEGTQGDGGRRASKDSIVSSASSAAESKLPKAVSSLMAFIFDQDYFDNSLKALNYDKEKMPLGKLSKKTLLDGYQVLKDLAGLIGTADNDEEIEELSNRYFSLIPHDFGRNNQGKLIAAPILSTPGVIKSEAEVLESLTDMQLTNDIMKFAKGKDRAEKLALADRQFQGLGLQEMTPLDPKSAEYQHLADYLTKSAGETHDNIDYSIQDIFRIERAEDTDRFDQSEYSDLAESQSDRALLWHGSRSTNYGGILSQGLRIAPKEAPASGYMFGKGVYLANMSTKSANYCWAESSGDQGLLLLCEAELGKPSLKLVDADYNAGDRAKDEDCISTWGVGLTTPVGWKDAGCIHESLEGVKMPDLAQPCGPSNEDGAWLQYDEFICYDVAQVKLRYLIRTGM